MEVVEGGKRWAMRREGAYHVQLVLDLRQNVHVTVLGGGWVCHCCVGW